MNESDHLLIANQCDDAADYLEPRELGYGGDAWADTNAPCIEGVLLQSMGMDHGERELLWNEPSYDAVCLAAGQKPRLLWQWNDEIHATGWLHTKQDALDLLRSTAKAHRIFAEQCE